MSSTTCYNKTNILKSTKQFHSYEEFYLTFVKDSVPIDLTGLEITWDFRKDSTEGILIKELKIGDGLEIVTVGLVTKLKVETFSLDVPGNIYYDIRMHFPLTDKIKYYVGGIVIVKSVVTKQDG